MSNSSNNWLFLFYSYKWNALLVRCACMLLFFPFWHHWLQRIESHGNRVNVITLQFEWDSHVSFVILYMFNRMSLVFVMTVFGRYTVSLSKHHDTAFNSLSFPTKYFDFQFCFFFLLLLGLFSNWSILIDSTQPNCNLLRWRYCFLFSFFTYSVRSFLHS